MKTKNKFIIGAVLTILILIVLLFQNYSKSVKNIRGGILIKQEFSESIDTTILADYDSVFHTKISSNYGVAWKSVNAKKGKYKIILFDSKIGEVLVYYFDKNQNITTLSNVSADKSFGWEFSNNKINGMYSFIQKDTTFYWLLNEEKQQLIDENGFVFKKIRISKKQD